MIEPEDDQHTTHRTARELVLHDLREWAKDVAHQGRTGISPLEAVRQLALSQKNGSGQGRIQATETRVRREAPDTPVRRLPRSSLDIDAALHRVRRVDANYHRVLVTWACLGTVRGVADELHCSRAQAGQWFEGGVAVLLVTMEFG